ncbi:MAG: helix-hairpin-helix domain-containing protein [Thermoguttaceae bacterium]
MKLFQRFHKLLLLAVAAALLMGNNVTKLWAAPEPAEERSVPSRTAKLAKLVDINTATTAELEDVPGIGPAYAKKIIANRPYASVKDLSKTGIPAARLEKFLPLVTVKEKVPAKEKPAATSGKTVTASRTEKSTALVDINMATAEQLEALPGVGPAYAKKIIAARPYASAKDLSKSGIPAARLEKIAPLVTVTQRTAVTEKTAEKVRPAAGGSSAMASKTAKSDKTAEKTSIEARTPPRKGMVWVNTNSKIYHVEGDRWYGKTKEGEWMTEDDAVKAGYRKSK